MSEKRIEAKARTWWITCIQFLFLFYYLSYSDTLISNNIILVASCLVLFIEVIMRVIHNSWRMSLCVFVAFVASMWGAFCCSMNGSGLGSAITLMFLLVSVSLFAETRLLQVQRKKLMTRMTFSLLLILIVFSKTNIYRSTYMPILPYFSDSVRINPNCIAMLTFFLFVCVFEAIEDTVWRKRRKRILQFGAMILSVYYIFLTSARTSILACIAFMLLFFVCKYRDQKLTQNLFLLGLCLSLCIVFIYIGMYSSGFMRGDTFFGKNIYSGRQLVWADALEALRGHWLVGFSNKIAFGPNQYLSTHNSLLAILCYFGVFGLLSTITILFMSFKKIQCKNHPIMVSAIFSTLILMSFETVITDWSLLVPFCLFFVQTRSSGGAAHDS